MLNPIPLKTTLWITQLKKLQLLSFMKINHQISIGD